MRAFLFIVGLASIFCPLFGIIRSGDVTEDGLLHWVANLTIEQRLLMVAMVFGGYLMVMASVVRVGAF